MGHVFKGVVLHAYPVRSPKRRDIGRRNSAHTFGEKRASYLVSEGMELHPPLVSCEPHLMESPSRLARNASQKF